MVAADAGEAVFQVAAVQELAHHLGDDRAQEAVAGLETLFVGGKKGVEVPGQALPEGRGAGFAGAVGLHSTWVYATRARMLHRLRIFPGTSSPSAAFTAGRRGTSPSEPSMPEAT